MRCSVYIVFPAVLSCSNLKLHQTSEVKNIFKQEKMLQLTFNPGLLLTGFRTTHSLWIGYGKNTLLETRISTLVTLDLVVVHFTNVMLTAKSLSNVSQSLSHFSTYTIKSLFIRPKVFKEIRFTSLLRSSWITKVTPTNCHALSRSYIFLTTLHHL